MSCPCPPPGPPTLAGFSDFIYNQMGVPVSYLPTNSQYITLAFCVAQQIVNRAIQGVSPLMYNLALYNLGGSNLINYAQDPKPIVPYPPGTTVPPGQLPVGYFGYLRGQWNILGFVAGVIQSSSDESTSQSMVVQDAAKNFTLSDLQKLKDPFGRTYLQIAQEYGPSAWGLT